MAALTSRPLLRQESQARRLRRHLHFRDLCRELMEDAVRRDTSIVRRRPKVKRVDPFPAPVVSLPLTAEHQVTPWAWGLGVEAER